MKSLLLPREVAELLRCDLRTVRRLGERGELTRVRVGARLVRYTPESVAALVNPPDETAVENFISPAPSPSEGGESKARAG